MSSGYLSGTSLGTRFILLLCIAVIAVVAIGSGILLVHEHQKMVTELDSKGRSLAKFLSRLAIESFVYINPEKLDAIVDEAVKEDDIVCAFFFDPSNRPVTSLSKSVDLQDSFIRELIREDMTSEQAWEILRTRKDTFVILKTPVSDGKTLYGSLALGLSKARINANFRTAIISMLGLGIIMIASLSLVVFLLFRRATLQPLREIISITEKARSGDLTVTIQPRGAHEVVALANAINALILNLRDMIFKVRKINETINSTAVTIAASSQHVLGGATAQKQTMDQSIKAFHDINAATENIASSAETLNTLSEGTAASVLEMNSSIGMISENTHVFHETSQDTASSIEEMIASIKQITEHLEHLSRSSEETSAAISELSASVKEVERSAHESVMLAEKVNTDASVSGMTAVNTAMKGINEIKDTMTALSEVIYRLRNRSEEISKILGVIDGIADQTTLLAINAAILASKAGEHGRGFSVVANEIKDLAERTTVSTGEIASLITSVQEEAKSSVDMTARGMRSVEHGAELFSHVGSALNSIIESSQTSTEMAKTIQRATTQESNVINQITESVRVIVEQIAQITNASTEQSKGSRFIVDATERIKNVSTQVRTSINEQSMVSRQINDAVENIASQISHIADATNRHKSRSAELTRGLEEVSLTADELLRATVLMSTEVESLAAEAQNLAFELKQFKL